MFIDAELLARATRFCESLAASDGPVDDVPADDEALGTPEESFFRRARAARPVHVARVDRGQLWVVAPPAETPGARALLLVTLLDGARAQGYLASEEAWLARDIDVVLGSDETPTATALVVILDRPVSMPRACLVTFVGALPRPTWTRIAAIVERRQRGAPVTRTRWVTRAEVPGARGAARRLALNTFDGEVAPPQWLSGEPVIDDDPRVEALFALAQATRWMPAPVVARSPAQEPEPRALDRMIARLGALIASLPAMPALEPAAGFGALVGATRGIAERRGHSRSFRIALDPLTFVEVRLSLDGRYLHASAHFTGAAGEPCPDGRMAIRNAATGERVAGAADAHGVMLPVSLAFGDAEAGELTLSRGGAGDREAVRLAF